MNSSTYYYESKLSEKLGISRDELTAYRRQFLKKKSGDWAMLGRDVVLSHGAVDRFLSYWVEKTQAAPDAAAILACAVPHQKKNGAPAILPNGPVDLVVKRRYPNVHLLLATDSTGGDHRVWVPANDNFRPDMKLKARPQGPGKPHKLVGRCPRYPGRW